MRRLAALACAVSLLASCSTDHGSIEELCAAWKTLPNAEGLFAGFDPSDAPHALEQLESGSVILHELRNAAPEEQRDDLAVEIAYVDALIDRLSELDSTDPEDAAEVVSRVTAEHPDVDGASARLAEFSQESCAAP